MSEYIYKKDQLEEVVENARIFIIFPVILSGSNELWSREYNQEKIRFYIKDKSFLEASQTKKNHLIQDFRRSENQ
ncbi:hypothetical protein [Lactococcus ileimucosae]|uniref:hypothetical protein n=1 Tax=Lactococcus ileimucosae TaxID=2941329 RepID=UPI0020435933|nr:hypothetical protein [Lactococcus ileimucosae]